jgi:hypothetical protein
VDSIKPAIRHDDDVIACHCAARDMLDNFLG